MTAFDRLVGRFLSTLAGHSVDKVLSSLSQTLHALEHSAAKLVAKANKHYTLSAHHEGQGDRASLESERAKRVADKLRGLVE